MKSFFVVKTSINLSRSQMDLLSEWTEKLSDKLGMPGVVASAVDIEVHHDLSEVLGTMKALVEQNAQLLMALAGEGEDSPVMAYMDGSIITT